ncbi:MAG: hypothetical protein ACAI35_04375 [Candidatus Methylacidiphilales bacterium]|nr:hypothetical protein [Candidatus Methylacidiphilales bacterium]
MPTFNRKRIRLRVDGDQDEKFQDALTSATPVLWRGNDVQIELGLFFGGLVADDISNLTSVTLEAKLSQVSAEPPVISKTVSVFDNTLTLETWTDKSKQHAVIPLTAAETNLSLSGATEKTYWLTVSAVTSAGYAITLGVSSLLVREDNAGTAGTPPTNDPTYLTAAETTALVEDKISSAELLAALRGTATDSWESGATTLAADVDTVTVPFTVAKTSADYEFLALHVRNLSGDAVKAAYFVSPIDQTDEEFTVQLSGNTLSANYVLVWHVVALS